jgi:outer membrane protein OmpA-like peptidoglycan-associated protein
MKFIFFMLILLAANVFALPVGDPRTPNESMRSQMEVPISQGVHELSVHTFMGVSKIDYPDMGGTRFSPGYGAAITYSYFFFPKWSFLVGGGLQLFNNRGTNVDGEFSGELIANDLPDHGSDEVVLKYVFSGYEETQWSLMFMVPLMLQYQTNESRNKAFYYALGAKLGFPFAGSYMGKAESATIVGCYPRISADACTDNPDLGFGDFSKMSSYMKLKLGTTFFAAAEAGVKWRLYNKLAVYTGFWLDWALNDPAIRSVSDQPFTWTPTEGLSLDKKTPQANLNFVSRTNGKAIPVSMGFAVRFSFGAGSRAEADSIRWIKEIIYRDSIIDHYKTLEDSVAHLNDQVEILLDSLIDCRRACMTQVQSKAELRRQADSLAEAKRLAALAAARQDSLARAEQLEKEKLARLEDFRKKMASLANGLDDYKVTQTVPSDRAREKLDLTVELMRDYPSLKIRITGHTCNKGTHEANVRFGMQRAESAKNYLISKDISADRIEIASKAELEPVAPNNNEENRRKNRRVQLEILEGGEGIKQEAKQ